MRFLKFLSDNLLFILTLLLLAFIPLFPKIPLFDVKNTWVYIRPEDFFVLMALFIWLIYFFRKKITLKTPLTIPILIFWIVGAVATIHGVLLIFPNISDVFPNVALLSFLRRIEYMSLFFVAYAGIKDKKFLKYVIAVLVITLLAIVGYGFGQKYLGFPAFLTMNEEFAKGIPIQLSELSRVPSTFAGHYDLAAYLVLVIPILASLIFGIKNWVVRIILTISTFLGIVLMFMTVSRVSFFVLVISLLIVVFMYKRKLLLFTIPILAVLVVVFLSSSTTLLQRFTSTVKAVDVLVNADTGAAIGNPAVVTKNYLDGKIVKTSLTQSSEGVMSLVDPEVADPASAAGKFAFDSLPREVYLISASNTSTGETLPQGTGYINLALSPVTKKVHEFLYEKKLEGNATASAEVHIVYGDFIIKRASAYDLSFTTRFQGGWPRALESFMRNIFFGSGYGSVSLAVDNNYLRLLGEIGILGTLSFVGIFVTIGVFIKRTLPQVESPMTRSFVLGFLAGVVGLCLNAVLIDVFEASKVAFTLWLLTGVTLGTLALSQTKKIDLFESVKNTLSSSVAFIIYIALATVLIFSPMLENYFVGDDYTWFRWAVDCTNDTNSQPVCPPVLSQLTGYFTDANGFFYRPGTKAYFLLMYSTVWLNQAVYHLVSIFLHFLVAVFVFLLAKRVFQSTLYGGISVLFFLILSGITESVFWISSTGYLFNAVFILASMFLFALWQERRRVIFLVLSFLAVSASLLFHELGVVAPLLIVLFAYFRGYLPPLENLYRKAEYFLIALPVPIYLLLRYVAQSHWLQGDYNYNFLKLPFNAIGNSMGYFLLTVLGPSVLPFYNLLRQNLRDNLLVSGICLVLLFSLFYFVYRKFKGKINGRDKKILIFGTLFFLISLLPFLGLGNITSRYSYLSSIGIIIILIFLLEKVYRYLLSSGRDIALAVIIMLATVFYLFHVIQIQGLQSDWYEAGEKTRRFFTALDQKYVDYWSTETMELHFVNTPLKVGEAWVFPVGLKDALWLVYRNPKIQVFQDTSVKDALSQIEDPLTEKVFVFKDNNLIEVVNRRKLQ